MSANEKKILRVRLAVLTKFMIAGLVLAAMAIPVSVMAEGVARETKKTIDEGTNNGGCPQGYEWDEASQDCVIVVEGYRDNDGDIPQESSGNELNGAGGNTGHGNGPGGSGGSGSGTVTASTKTSTSTSTSTAPDGEPIDTTPGTFECGGRYWRDHGISENCCYAFQLCASVCDAAFYQAIDVDQLVDVIPGREDSWHTHTGFVLLTVDPKLLKRGQIERNTCKDECDAELDECKQN